MRINILNMNLRNFKGVRNLNIEFGQITNITGDNATGKTTLFDAFTWLLFGKNSEDAKDFNIKTLDAFNQPIHKLSHEVEAVLSVDGREMKFRRCYAEKWTKKRGSAIEEFTGHETTYYVDDVPLSQKEFQSRVDFMMNEAIAKMITNPLYFNQLKWQERRSVLEAMAGKISDADIVGNNEAFAKLIAEIGNESLVNFKKKIAAQKAKIKETLDLIPARIDEAQRSKPEVYDYIGIRNAISGVEAEIKGIDEAIENKSKALELEYRKIQDAQKELNELHSELNNAQAENQRGKQDKINELGGLIRDAESKLDVAKREINTLQSQITGHKAAVERLHIHNTSLRNDWANENAKTLTIDEHALNCPTCKQALPEEQRTNTVETLTKNFNEAKARKLNEINAQGTANKEEISSREKQITELETKVAELQSSVNQQESLLPGLKSNLTKIQEATVVDSERVIAAKAKIEAFVMPEAPVIDNEELKQKKTQLQNDLKELNAKLATEDQIKRIDERIHELETQERTQANELAELEKKEFTIAQFSKAKIETIESRINGKFKLVKFKMFEQQINGGESEACECIVNGVPYSDVNTAGKIAAGIDIINALTQHYKVSAPIWIDNRESIVRLPECNSQIINLIVSPGAKLHTGVEVPFAKQATSLFN